MNKQVLVQKARSANRDVIAHVRARRFWAADLAADTRDACMAEARRA
ncbi:MULTISPECIES: hypothetical protein [Pseudomonas]|nr:hypothetical protein [Pseudomonas protegens]QYM99531.1 hypothetical protein K1T36_20920 [Pseudomonas protegens]